MNLQINRQDLVSVLVGQIDLGALQNLEHLMK